VALLAAERDADAHGEVDAALVGVVHLEGVELPMQAVRQGLGRLEHAAAEAETQNRVLFRPVPMVLGVQACEQRTVALEQLLRGGEQEALAEAAGARQEGRRALSHQAQRQGGLVDMVVTFTPDRGEGLEPDGELLAQHEASGVIKARWPPEAGCALAERQVGEEG
jgi:hypothetical protein